MLCFTSTASV
uniref:Uncharacterized protein n=1 Tax=Rhizophora mucronata TaxID=61149 RepID=A0A2P2QJP5_RHIMU